MIMDQYIMEKCSDTTIDTKVSDDTYSRYKYRETPPLCSYAYADHCTRERYKYLWHDYSAKRTRAPLSFK